MEELTRGTFDLRTKGPARVNVFISPLAFYEFHHVTLCHTLIVMLVRGVWKKRQVVIQYCSSEEAILFHQVAGHRVKTL